MPTGARPRGWSMIELLGIGVADEAAGWLLRRVSARIGSGVLTLVVSRRPQERRAFLDAVSGRRVPQEGRVWVNGIPVARDTASRLRAHVAEVELSVPLFERRSLLWNVLAVGPRGFRTVQGCLRLPRPEIRRAAQEALELVGFGASAAQVASALDGRGRVHLRVARALARRPECVLAHDVDVVLPADEAQTALHLLRAAARRWSLVAFASVEDERMVYRAGDCVVALDDGGLVPGTAARAASS
jgi:ABC-type phosphate/phosphonate transport system ATPase subunit